MGKKDKSTLTPCQEMKKKWRYSIIWLRRRYLKERYYHMLIAILQDRGIEWENVNDYVVHSWNLARHSLERMYGLVKAWEFEDKDFFIRKPADRYVSSIRENINNLKKAIDSNPSDDANKKLNDALRQAGVELIDTAQNDADKRYKDKLASYTKSREFVDSVSDMFLLWEAYRQKNDTPPTQEGFRKFLTECQKTLNLSDLASPSKK